MFFRGDVQIVDLNPSEDFRAMSLCGLDPDTGYHFICFLRIFYLFSFLIK